MKDIKDYIIPIDDNTYVLAKSVINVLQKTNTGNVYNQIDDFIKDMVPIDSNKINMLITSAAFNYLEKYHRIKFTLNYMDDVRVYYWDLESSVNINFFLV